MPRERPPLPPIQLRRLYKNRDRKGDFIIEARPLPASFINSMTDAELEARYADEKKAIEAEWAKIREEKKN